MTKVVSRSAVRPTSVAGYITWQISLCGKPQVEIAREAGFPKPNVISMIKQGHTKLPLEKIGKFAKAIEVDPVFLLKLAMQEYMPETWAEIERMFNQPVLTENELELLDIIRSARVINPRVTSEKDRIALLDVINSLHGDNLSTAA